MKEQVQILISQGKTQKAFELLETAINHVNQRDEHAQLLLLMGRLSRNTKEKNLGFLDNGDYNKENNSINASLVSLLDDIHFSKNHAVQTIVQPVITSVVIKLDPIKIQHELTRERLNVSSEFASLSELGSDVITFLKEKTNYAVNDRLFLKNFQSLQWAFNDFCGKDGRKNEENAKVFIDELKNQQDLILHFLIESAKETPIEKLFQDAREAAYDTYIAKFRLYLEKAVLLKKVPHDALERFNNEFNELNINYGKAVIAEIQIENFKLQMMRRYGL